MLAQIGSGKRQVGFWKRIQKDTTWQSPLQCRNRGHDILMPRRKNLRSLFSGAVLPGLEKGQRFRNRAASPLARHR